MNIRLKDLECILHHPHTYSHSNQPDNSNSISSATDDIREGPPSHQNNTDPPVETVYMICVVVVAMALVGVVIVLLAVTISKLRKREDHGNDDVNVEQPSVVHSTKNDCKLPPTPPVSPTTPSMLPLTTTTTTTTVTQQTINDIRNNGIVNAGATINTTEFTNGNIDETNHFVNDNADQFVWQFPPPYPPSTPPPQYTLYNDQDTLVHGLQTDRQGFAKGMKKTIGGRWRRLTKKKESDTCGIPPELKGQLKTIYVY
ncbi:uncharacterized protein LOC122849863 isoform X2 [Aphidius gifuensis]|uniref:uncharacterized protein LOC122849863 isoform X2 n=1 Tax=Aphidius gifuensis TaxID=684658 RepID=UPI001CDD7494|nr:uncharacterized protein LOC122849863 isoform X2 [Aphidius gifuensis]